MVPSPRRPLVFSLLAAALIIAFLLQCFFASGVKSPAWDETGDIAAGLSYVETGKLTVNPQHPPLLKELSGLSLLASGAHYPDTPQARQLLAGQAQFQWPVGSDIIHKYGADHVMFWARLPLILLAAALGVVLYIWGRQMLGGGAALGALFLYALDPTVIAHSSLVTLDAGFAVFTVVFCFALWNYLRDPTTKRMLWCGVALGAVLVTKFSAVVLLPVAGLLLFAAVYKPPERVRGPSRGFFDLYRASVESKAKAGPNDPCPCGSGKKFKKCHGAGGQTLPSGSGLPRKLAISIAAFLALCVVAVVVVEITYLFPSDPFLYLTGMRLVNADHARDYRMFLAGNLDRHFFSYFAAAYLLKEPIASIALAIFGLVLLLRNRTAALLDKLFLLFPPFVIFAAHSVLADDMGIRYIIPVLPFAYLLGGLALAELASSTAAWKRWTGGILCLWMIVAAIGIYPDHLSYFNESACLLQNPGQLGFDGGTRCGPWWLDDSNVDWGEGLKQLKVWLDRHPQPQKIRLAYFGSYPPEYYGLAYDKADIEDLLRAPKTGTYVVSSHLLSRALVYGKEMGNGAADWLRVAPKAIIGHCLYVYQIP